MSRVPTARELGVIACHGCGLVCEHPHDDESLLQAPLCPRCGTHLKRRHAGSLGRATALLIASVIFYFPANLLPVMRTTQFGNALDSTIMEGVLEFWHSGDIGVALIIFIASVAVPCTKFLALGTLFWTTHHGSPHGLRERAKLYRIVEIVGYWSMLDVLVVALVCALVQFHSLSAAEPSSGILYFGLVVILTMLSAMQFDPRLIWDGKEKNESDASK